jgi:hypothetical protein
LGLRASPLVVGSIGLLSLVLLAFEVFLTRLLAYALDNSLLYVVLGAAMLGFGAAGSLVATRPGWLEPERLPRMLGWTALGFVPCFALSLAAFVRVTDSLVAWHSALCAASLLALPFLAGGTVLTLALASAAGRVGALYAANLIGSGLGCLVPFFLLGPLTGERLLGVLVASGYLAALGFVWQARPALRSPLGLASVALAPLSALALWQAPALFEIRPEPPGTGQVTRVAEYAREHGASMQARYDRWNPTGRIQVFLFGDVPGTPGAYPVLFYAQDAGAGSFLMRWDGVRRDGAAASGSPPTSLVARNCSQTLFGQGYGRPRSKVLVIGLGGGPDVQCALWHGAQQVDAVEINEDSIAAVRGPFDRWLGGIGSDPHVRYHHRDGRSFAHQARGANYDLITLSGVDTKSTMASGALALSENTLYTEEAFVDYLSSLAPSGALSILRFGSAEAIRLANTAAVALRRLGVTHPERHITVLSVGVLHGVLVQRRPLSPADAAAFAARYSGPDPGAGVRIFFYEPFGLVTQAQPRLEYVPGRVEAPGSLASADLGIQPADLLAPDGTDVRAFFDALSRDRLAEFQSRYNFDVAPTRDDRPFFFDIFRYDRAATWSYYHVRVLLGLLGSVLLLSVLLIVLPVWGRRASSAGFNWRALGYFGAIGLGFLCVEVWLLHRFGMYLGHQSRSLVVVLAGLLLATGVGALFGERLWPEPRRRVAIACVGVWVWIGLGALGLEPIQDASWSLAFPLKALLALGFVLPLGALLGLPFPAGLGWVEREARLAAPWCIGVNAFASVLASVAVVPLSMFVGYGAVLATGLAMYAAAGLLSRRFGS